MQNLSLYAEYNGTNLDGIRPLKQIDDISQIRGSGNYNPAPRYVASTNPIDESTYTKDLNKLEKADNLLGNDKVMDLYRSPVTSIEFKNSWSNKINNNKGLVGGANIELSQNQEYDKYQEYALKATRLTDPYLFPYFFAEVNVKFIQKKVVEYVKEHRNITINTEQDLNTLINLMVTHYLNMYGSNGVFESNFKELLGNLNKAVIEEYVKNVFSTLNMQEYYIKDISNLPVPLERPTNTNIKGKNDLGFVGFFEDNHTFTKNMQAYNMRDVIPGPL